MKRGRSQEGPARSSDTGAAEGGVKVVGGVAVVEVVLDLVEAMLEDSEAKEESDEDRHQYQASAEHAYPATTAETHPLSHSLPFPSLLCCFSLPSSPSVGC